MAGSDVSGAVDHVVGAPARRSEREDRQLGGEDTGWRTSSFSQTDNCVEVGRLDDLVLVRDSKDRSRGHLVFRPAQWRAFLAGVVARDFAPGRVADRG
jgi:hypothetical protein